MRKYLLLFMFLCASAASAQTIADKLTTINNIRLDIKAALASKSQTVGDDFSVYDDAVASITSGDGPPWQDDYSGFSWTTATESTPMDLSQAHTWLASWTLALPSVSAVAESGASTYAYGGGCITLDGDGVFAPWNANAIAIYRHELATFEYVNFPGIPDSAFSGAVLTGTGEVVLIPRDAPYTAVFNPTTNDIATYAHSISGTALFFSGTLLPSGKILYSPFASANLVVFDPVAKSHATSIAHGCGPNAFAGATLATDGVAILTPFYSDRVGIYRDSDSKFMQGYAHGVGDGAWLGGGQLLPNGKIMFSPHLTTAPIGLFTPNGIGSGTYAAGPAHGAGSTAYTGCRMMPDRSVWLTPYAPDYVLRYDYLNNCVGNVCPHANPSDENPHFYAGVLLENGLLIFSATGASSPKWSMIQTGFTNISLSDLTNPVANRP